jgi:hypothetical protein
MGFFDVFRRRPPVRELPALADFIDQQAAFLAQRGIYEYSRARAGPHGNVLLREPMFQAAVDKSRWEAYPLALAMVAEMVEGVLRPRAGAAEAAVRGALIGQVTAVLDRYPAPAGLEPAAWLAARDGMLQRLHGMVLHPPKPVKDIVEPFAEPYLALMPIHEKLRGRDFPALRNYLKVGLINIHGEFLRRADMPALIEALAREGEPAAAQPSA